MTTPPQKRKAAMSPVHRAIAVSTIFLFICLVLVIAGAATFITGDTRRALASFVENITKDRPADVVYVQPEPQPVNEEFEEMKDTLFALARFDYPEGTPVPDADKYVFHYTRILDYWGERNPLSEIQAACTRVYGLKRLYPDMTMLHSMQLFSQEIPPEVVFEEESAAQITVTEDADNPEFAFQPRTKRATVVSATQSRLRIEAENVLAVAEEIYARSEAAYYEPILAAQEEAAAIAEANAQHLQNNRAAAQARGRASNSAKAEASRAAAAAQQQYRENNAEASRQTIERARAQGIIR